MALINPNPQIKIVPLPGYKPCIVIDNFLADPQAIVDHACNLQDKFAITRKNAFPGPEMRMPDEFSDRLNDFFILHVGKLLGVRRTLSMFSRLSMITLQPQELSSNQRICHQDHPFGYPQHSFSASVLYLFKNDALGGTSFYRPKVTEDEIARLYSSSSEWQDLSREQFAMRFGTTPNYMTQSNSYFELIGTIPPAWNRIIFYDGGIFHSGHITQPELLSKNPAQGRLTINGFFTGRKSIV
jgi:hypothetical protein